MLKYLIICTFLLFLSALSGIAFAEKEWTTYEDPDGKFSLEYPTEWFVIPRQSMFDLYDIQIYDKNPILDDELTIAISYKADIDTEGKDVDKFIELFSQMQMKNDPTHRIVESDTSTYDIDGNEARGYIFEQKKLDDTLLGGLFIVSFPNDHLFSVNYAALQNTFEEHLPIVEKIIESIRIIE